MGRWSSLVAARFVEWLDQPDGCRWLDVGCGTGALSQSIAERAAPSRLHGLDPSAAFVEYARRRVVGDEVTFGVGDALDVDADDDSFDVAVCGLVLNFVPDQRRALSEMSRVVAPGGLVAAYVWDYPGEMWMITHFWDAVVALDPSAAELHQGRLFATCRPEVLEPLFENAQLRDVESRAIDVATVFDDFDGYWTPFLGGQGTAPAYLASLGDGERARVRDAVRQRLPVAADGSIRLTARAWAVRGKV